MVSDSEPETGTADEQNAEKAPVSAADRPKKKKAKRPRQPIPRTEPEINSPTKQTLGMLGVLGAMTIVMWALARGGCNYHPPKETRTPRKVTTEELARDPKNAAIELQQRWLTRDFAGAGELATGEVAQQLQQDKAACNAACLAEQKSLASKVLTSAVVLDANILGATVRVTSLGASGGPKVFLMRLERSESVWKATMRKPDDGTPLPALPTPAPHDGMMPFSPFSPPAAPASAAPAASGAPPSRPHPVLTAPAPAASH
jgi:hypothetical protein